MIRFCKYIVLTGIFCGSLACTPSKTTQGSSTSGCCGTQIKGVCLVHYSDPAGSTYITRQTQTFCPCSLSLEIQAQEPQGRWIWRLRDGEFSTTSPNKNSTQNSLFDKNLSLAVFYSMASATELLPSNVIPSGPVKLEGQWYTPFVRHVADTTVTLLQSRDSAKFDLVKIQDNKTTLLAQSYNFQFNKALEKNIPRTIDVFDITDGFSAKKLIVQMQYIQIEPLIRTE
jgi:hypothetical protein